jgi:ABC-type amino acid transport substrate-binding protein
LETAVRARRWLGALAVWLWFTGLALAAEPVASNGLASQPVADREMRIGVVVAPPFITKNDAGHYAGISLDLWRDVAHDLDLTWRVTEYDLVGLLAAVRQGAVDVGMADLSITPEREAVMDFSLPYYATGLGIMVAAQSGETLFPAVLSRILSLRVLGYAGSLLGLLLGVGLLMWAIERRRNPEHFRPSRRGIGDGLWWTAVTMTAVGYGDTTPRTLLGRTVALVWMFASVVLLAFFTAGITSSLTLEGIGGAVRGPGDLHKVRTGVVRGSSAEEALVASHEGVWPYDRLEDGLRALVAGELGAFVHDRPILRYLQHHQYAGWVRILPGSFEQQLYAFAFPAGSNLRKAVNVAMLRRLEDRDYRLHLFGRYLGKDER